MQKGQLGFRSDEIQKGGSLHSVVQWHPVSLFFVAAPVKMVLPKKGSLFFPGHGTAEYSKWPTSHGPIAPAIGQNWCGVCLHAGALRLPVGQSCARN